MLTKSNNQILQWINSLEEPFECDESKIIFQSADAAGTHWTMTTIDATNAHVQVNGKEQSAKVQSSKDELRDHSMQIDQYEGQDEEGEDETQHEKNPPNGSNANQNGNDDQSNVSHISIISIRSGSTTSHHTNESEKITEPSVKGHIRPVVVIINSTDKCVAVNGAKRCGRRDKCETEVNFTNDSIAADHHQMVDHSNLSNISIISINTTSTDRDILPEKNCIFNDFKLNTLIFDVDQNQRMDDGTDENFIKCTHCDMTFDELHKKWKHECLIHKPQVKCYRILKVENHVSTAVQLNSCAAPVYNLRKRK